MQTEVNTGFGRFRTPCFLTIGRWNRLAGPVFATSVACSNKSQELVTLEPHEFCLPCDSDEFLWRQITPIIWNGEKGQPKIDAFGPKTADMQKPSFSRSKLVTAKESFTWHNKHANSKSLAVWACRVSDCGQIDLQVIDDYSNSSKPKNMAPGHAYVDYRGLSKKEERDKRAELLMAALDYGQQYPPV